VFRPLRTSAAIVALMMLAGGPLSGCVDKPTEHRVRANAYLRGGDADKAVTECDEGLKQTPGDVGLLILRGKAQFELDRFDDAAQSYQKALEAGKGMAEKSLAEAHLGLAMIATRKKNWKEAHARFTKLTELNPTDADARLNLARVCLRTDDLECAVKSGEEAAKLRPEAEDVLFTLGRIYLVAKKYEAAGKAFDTICKVVPNAASCPYGAALVAAQQGDKAKALAKLEEAVARKLPSPDKLGDDPLLAPLKGDPGFTKLVAANK
jgi:tetratricopeptide (TPR) repeat protein